MNLPRTPPAYRCTECGQVTERSELTVKRVSFLTMGNNAKRLRSRTEGWLCLACRAKDSVWNMDDARRGRNWYPDQ